MIERSGFEVECPCCGHEFKALRQERPFRRVTRDSVSRMPPTVRMAPKNQTEEVRACEHCGSDFRRARGEVLLEIMRPQERVGA